MRLYLDSNVVLSRLLKEFGKKFEFMDNAVDRFLAVCVEDNHVLILSDLFFEEVKAKGYTSKEEVKKFMLEIGLTQIIEVEREKTDYDKSLEISKKFSLHKKDALHVQLALKTRSDYLITWDKDFQKQDLVKVISPREFI